MPRRLPPRQGAALDPPTRPSGSASDREEELVVAAGEGPEAERDQEVLGGGWQGTKGADDAGTGGRVREARGRGDFPALRNVHGVHLRRVPAGASGPRRQADRDAV